MRWFVLSKMLVSLPDDDELTQAIDEHAGAIRQETLAIILDSIKDGYEVVALVEGKSLNITLKKA